MSIPTTTDAVCAFKGATNLSTCHLQNASKLTTCTAMFYESGITTTDVGVDYSILEDMMNMFGFSKLKSIAFNIDGKPTFPACKNMDNAFFGCHDATLSGIMDLTQIPAGSQINGTFADIPDINNLKVYLNDVSTDRMFWWHDPNTDKRCNLTVTFVDTARKPIKPTQPQSTMFANRSAMTRFPIDAACELVTEVESQIALDFQIFQDSSFTYCTNLSILGDGLVHEIWRITLSANCGAIFEQCGCFFGSSSKTPLTVNFTIESAPNTAQVSLTNAFTFSPSVNLRQFLFGYRPSEASSGPYLPGSFFTNAPPFVTFRFGNVVLYESAPCPINLFPDITDFGKTVWNEFRIETEYSDNIPISRSLIDTAKKILKDVSFTGQYTVEAQLAKDSLFLISTWNSNVPNAWMYTPIGQDPLTGKPKNAFTQELLDSVPPNDMWGAIPPYTFKIYARGCADADKKFLREHMRTPGTTLVV